MNVKNLIVTIKLILISFFLAVCAGIQFGYPALRPVMIDTGIYSNLCTPKEPPPCKEQQLRLDYMFQMSVTAFYISGVILSWISDAVSKKLQTIISGLIWFLSVLFMGLGEILNLDSFVIAFCGIAVSGLGMFFAWLKISTDVPGKWLRIAMGFVTASWDISTSLFFLFYAAYFYLKIPLRWLWIGYSVLGIGVIVFGLFIDYPKSQTEPQTDEEQPKQDPMFEGDDPSDKLFSFLEWITLYRYAKKEKFKYVMIILGMFMNTSVMLQMFNYLTNLQSHLEWTSGESEAEHQAYVFYIMLPILGTICGIIAGKVMDYTRLWKSMVILLLMNLVWSVTQVIRVSALQYVTMTVFIIYRMSYFVVSNHFIFGPYYVWTMQGRVSGIVYLFVGITSMFLLPQFSRLVAYQLNGSWFWIDIGLAILSLTTSLAFTVGGFFFEKMYVENEDGETVQLISENKGKSYETIQ